MSDIAFEKIDYVDLNARQKELFNFQKASAILADYGFQTIWLTSDWGSADFIAQHIDGETFLKVQLKGGLTFGKKYMKKDIWVCFREGHSCYLYPHDTVLEEMLTQTNIANTRSWIYDGAYHYPKVPHFAREILKHYRLGNGNNLETTGV